MKGGNYSREETISENTVFSNLENFESLMDDEGWIKRKSKKKYIWV